MNTIKTLLAGKAKSAIISVVPEDTVFVAVTRMVENNIGAILVMEAGAIKGIMSERDYLRFITVQGRTARDTPVKDLMTDKVIYVTPETDLPEVMSLMTKARIRHVPVMDGNHLMGIVSIGDVVKQISKDQDVKIRTLEDYISDVYPGPANTD